METYQLKKISILGLVLTAASAVTAAFLPAKNEVRAPGVLVGTNTPSVSGQLTCIVGTGSPVCTVNSLFGTSTTVIGNTSRVQNSSVSSKHSSNSPV